MTHLGMIRFVAAVAALVAMAVVPATSVSHHVWAASTAPHRTSITSQGFRLTLQTPGDSYPPNALIRVSVTLENLSNPHARLQMCAGFQPDVTVISSAGTAVEQPVLPVAYPRPACFDPTVPVPFTVGQTERWSGLLVLTEPRLRATADISLGSGTGLGGTPVSIRTPVLSFRVAPAAPTAATVQTSPRLHIAVRHPQGRPIYYSDHTECPVPYEGNQIAGTTGWQRGGDTITPETIAGCPAISRWRVVVAVQGEAPATFDLRPAPPAVHLTGLTAPNCSAASAHPGVVAVAWSGAVYEVGTGRPRTCRVTGTANAIDPVASPDGSHVAFVADRSPQRGPITLAVAVVGKPNRVRILGDVRLGRPDQDMAWSPNGKELAYLYGGAVYIRRADGSHPRQVISSYPGGIIRVAWLPDGSGVVGLGGFWGTEGKRTVIVNVARLTGSTAGEVATFPTWISNPEARPAGSFPWWNGAVPAPDERHIFLTTTGGGVRVSGVWEVPLPGTGGVPHLVLGTRARVQGHPAPAAHLDGATHIFGSPDGQYLVTDPRTGFWVENTRTGQGRLLRVTSQPGCVVSQSRWMPGTGGIAYVQTCRLEDGAAFRATLVALSLDGTTHRLASVVDRQPDALALAPVYRCVGCSYNPDG
jgi:hypothetical protein